jgi:MFS family permease
LIAALAASGQFASIVFAPAMPAAAAALKATASQITITATVFMAASAVTMLLAGPLSDRFGRRAVALFGVIVFIAGSAAGLYAAALAALLFSRATQAVGSSFMLVAANAATRDVFSGSALRRASAVIAVVFSLAPALAPLLGGAATQFLGYASTFALSIGLGLIVLAWAG